MVNPVIATMIRMSGRSWWQARYVDGRVIGEWDTLTGKILLPVGSSRTSRWEEVSKKGMVGLRLLCPNGMAGELEAPEGHKFFQLKVGGVSVGMGLRSDGGGKISRFCDAHIIGVIKNADGGCVCRAWENKERRLIEFHDNVFSVKYRGIGRLNLDVQGLKI